MAPQKEEHSYVIHTTWTGNKGSGTSAYNSYERAHIITAPEKLHDILGTSDPSFKGDPKRYNPEELFVSSLSTCHMLWYLHLCATNRVTVLRYEDNAVGKMLETPNGSGAFTEIVLSPIVTIANENNLELARQLHEKANKMCFIANSCNFLITHTPTIKV